MDKPAGQNYTGRKLQTNTMSGFGKRGSEM